MTAKLLAALMMTAAAIGCAAPARAGSLDNCGTWGAGRYDTSPHCMDQLKFCEAFATEAMSIAFYSTQYSDHRDIAAMLTGNVLPEDALALVIDNLIPYRAKAGLRTTPRPPPHTPERQRVDEAKENEAVNAFFKRVASDCVGGTIDFIDNAEPQ